MGLAVVLTVVLAVVRVLYAVIIGPVPFLVADAFFEVVFLTVARMQRISLMFAWKNKSRERSGSKSQSPN